MLFLLFGSSAAGKTSVIDALRRKDPVIACHDFDEVGVSADPDAGWRQRTGEEWLRRALRYQAEGIDLLLAGQTPFGELLATPSAPRLECIAACLLHCDVGAQLARLRPLLKSTTYASRHLQDLLNWGVWMRRHAEDPQFRPYVLQERAWSEMAWERWSDWQARDPRWRVSVVDTSHRSLQEVADMVAAWIAEERDLFRAGVHPLENWA